MDGSRRSRARLARDWVALALWMMATWVLLTWSPFTFEEEAFGAGFALALAAVLVRYGAVAAPWAVLAPRRLASVVALIGVALVRIVIANVELAYRIWAPARPIAPGMVVVPTRLRTPGGLTAVGLITSLIVDNQIVDLDRTRNRLQYHAIAVSDSRRSRLRASINAPVERFIAPLSERRKP